MSEAQLDHEALDQEAPLPVPCKKCGVKNAAANCACDYKGEKMDDWTPLVIASLKTRFGAKTDQLFTLLKETQSLISGGSVLAACIGEPIEKQDTDIYVPVANIPRFLAELVKPESPDNEPIFPATLFSRYAASFYCTSFLRKNGIRKVYNFAIGDKEEKKAEVDVMAVRNKRGPLAVVNNFDLTFCQVWFDGVDVYASHPEHIKTKKGELQYDYCITLLEGNRFLKRRIKKYMTRGFDIRFNEQLGTEDAFSQILSNLRHRGDGSKKVICTNSLALRDKFADEDFAKRWYYRIAMRYFLGIRDSQDKDDKPLLILPLIKNIYYNQEDDKDNIIKRLRSDDIKNYHIEKDDGYDTDTMDDAELKSIAQKNYVLKENEVADDIMKFYRVSTNLVINSKKEDRRGNFTLAKLANYKYGQPNPIYGPEKARSLLNLIETKALRQGDDLFGETGPLYDIHYHPEDGATTRKSLEEYLGSTMGGDEYDVKCYYSAAGCDMKLTLNTIKALVSPEFYKLYSAPRPKKSGLNLEVDNFEAVFRNIKTVDPAWGNIYHATMCPYCLKFEERGYGCAIMVHENPKGLPGKDAPFCQAGRQVKELMTKYKNLGKRLEDGYVHMEFCVECGRPCVNHKHFSLDLTTLIENQQIPDPSHPGQMMYDYGTCPGGGRPELIARMMAVRDVYRRKNLRVPDEERLQAARAADAAPLNPALMARATDLWAKAKPGLDWNENKNKAIQDAKTAAKDAGKSDVEQRDAGLAAAKAYQTANPEPPQLQWDIIAPKTKMYKDPLYERDGAVNDPNYTQWIEAPDRASQPIPNSPPSVEANNWNEKAIEFLANITSNKGVMREFNPTIKAEIEEDLEQAQEYYDTFDEGEPQLIDRYMVSCLIMLYVYLQEGFGPQKKLIASLLAKAHFIGGDNIKNRIHTFDVGEANQPKLEELKVAMKAELDKLFAVAGGTYKRRRGKPSKKTRVTRKSKSKSKSNAKN